MEPLNVGIFGFGCVGQGFYEILSRRNDPTIKVSKIVVKTPGKKRPVDEELVTLNPKDILDDPSINLVIEVTDDCEAAFEIVSEAMSKGKHIVSANKKMIAEKMDDLVELQEKHGVLMFYESAVAACIPVLLTVGTFYSGEKIKSFSGILNGSSNYILSKIKNDGLSYEAALKEAQDKGFAESDPTMDVGGFDAKFKLLIMLYHVYGIAVKPREVLNIGIDKISKTDIEFAASRGFSIKHLASASINNEVVSAVVSPAFVPKDLEHYSVEYEFNSILLDGEYTGKHFKYGRGAGSLPTGLAVYSDVKLIQSGFKLQETAYQDVNFENSYEIDICLSSSESVESFHSDFTEIYSTSSFENRNYLFGKISSDRLSLLSKEDVSIIVLDELNHILDSETIVTEGGSTI
ncbi:MAG: homoserine dehydrogenase [Bacteroidota bacterium]